jgi:outer membrane protein TolC
MILMPNKKSWTDFELVGTLADLPDPTAIYGVQGNALSALISECIENRKQIAALKEQVEILKDAYQCAKDRAKDKF